MSSSLQFFGRDLSHAIRRLASTPIFTCFAVGSLALGIGFATAGYSVIHAVIGPPPGVSRLDFLVRLRGNWTDGRFTPPEFRAIDTNLKTFEAVATDVSLRVSYAANGHAGSGYSDLVSGGYFTVFGIRPAMGRLIQRTDDRPGAPAVVVISDRIWRQTFEASADVVGRAMKINGAGFEIIGVMPPEFRGIFDNGIIPTDVWTPLSTLGIVWPALTSPDDALQLHVYGLLRRGHAREQATAEINAIAAALDVSTPIVVRNPDGGKSSQSRRWSLEGLDRAFSNSIDEGSAKAFAAVVWIPALVVLLVACSNLANLALARGSSRRQEFAIRLALGGSRWRIAREAVAESALVALAGGAAGIGVARAIDVLLSGEFTVGANIGTLQITPAIDWKALVAAFGATLVALALSGIGPVLQSIRADVRSTLTGGQESTAPRWRGRRWLIGVQIAVSAALVMVSAACLSQLRQQANLIGGLDLAPVAVAEVAFGTQGYDVDRVNHVVANVLTEMRHRPSVGAVSASVGLPIELINGVGSLWTADPKTPATAIVTAGTAEMCQTFGARLLSGRLLAPGDEASGHPVVVSESVAKALFGTVPAIGHLKWPYSRTSVQEEQPDEVRTIVGVVANTSAPDGFFTANRGLAYVPLAQLPAMRVFFAARGKGGDTSRLAADLRQAIRSVDPDLAVGILGPATDAIDRGRSMVYRLLGGIATVLGGVAWALALAGLYGVLSHVVAGRTKEIGVRVAIGAEKGDVLAMVFREGAAPILAGIAVGWGIGSLAIIGFRTSPIVRLFPAIDPTVYVLIPVVFLAGAALACYLPARRAASVDPLVALRDL